MVIMKKILFSLIFISIALVGISLVNAADVDDCVSDLPIAGSDIRLDDSALPVIGSDAPADVDFAKLPDLWASSDSISWTHHERNPGGFDSADLDSLGWNHDHRHQRG